jgi:hypothetical protein
MKKQVKIASASLGDDIFRILINTDENNTEVCSATAPLLIACYSLK